MLFCQENVNYLITYKHDMKLMVVISIICVITTTTTTTTTTNAAMDFLEHNTLQWIFKMFLNQKLRKKPPIMCSKKQIA